MLQMIATESASAAPRIMASNQNWVRTHHARMHANHRPQNGLCFSALGGGGGCAIIVKVAASFHLPARSPLVFRLKCLIEKLREFRACLRTRDSRNLWVKHRRYACSTSVDKVWAEIRPPNDLGALMLYVFPSFPPQVVFEAEDDDYDAAPREEGGGVCLSGIWGIYEGRTRKLEREKRSTFPLPVSGLAFVYHSLTPVLSRDIICGKHFESLPVKLCMKRRRGGGGGGGGSVVSGLGVDCGVGTATTATKVI